MSEKTRIVEGGAGPGFLALRQLGVWEKVCYDIVAERGDPFAYKLACYARWANTVAADGNRAGFARRTWKGFEGWPDRFEQWFDRQEKLANQQAHLEANARAAKPKAAPPPVASSEPIPPDVLDRAFAEIVQKARPERRKITIDRGKNAPDVEARARLMMKQKPEGTA